MNIKDAQTAAVVRRAEVYYSLQLVLQYGTVCTIYKAGHTALIHHILGGGGIPALNVWQPGINQSPSVHHGGRAKIHVQSQGWAPSFSHVSHHSKFA
jgi:hypothetical protein